MSVFGDIIMFIGACVRYAIGYTLRSLTYSKKFTFPDYLYGIHHPEDGFGEFSNRFINFMVGMGTIIGIILLIKRL